MPARLRTAERLLRWPVKRVVVAHDTIVELQSPDQLAQAFEWLRWIRRSREFIGGQPELSEAKKCSEVQLVCCGRVAGAA